MGSPEKLVATERLPLPMNSLKNVGEKVWVQSSEMLSFGWVRVLELPKPSVVGTPLAAGRSWLAMPLVMRP